LRGEGRGRIERKKRGLLPKAAGNKTPQVHHKRQRARLMTEELEYTSLRGKAQREPYGRKRREWLKKSST